MQVQGKMYLTAKTIRCQGKSPIPTKKTSNIISYTCMFHTDTRLHVKKNLVSPPHSCSFWHQVWLTKSALLHCCMDERNLTAVCEILLDPTEITSHLNNNCVLLISLPYNESSVKPLLQG